MNNQPTHNSAASMPAPTQLNAQRLKDPLGLDEPFPKLSWQWNHDTQGELTHWEVEAASAIESFGAPDLWQSGWRAYEHNEHRTRYAGKKLAPGQRAYWRVRTRRNDEVSTWSLPASFGRGLGAQENWAGANWVASASEHEEPASAVACLRHNFDVTKPVAHATLYWAARGVADAYINGQLIGDGRLQPGWTDFSKRIQYVAYDVTRDLKDGQNALCFELADGWYCGFLGWDGKRGMYGRHPSLLACLHIKQTDGTLTTVSSDESWLCTTDSIRRSADLYMGESIDARNTLIDSSGSLWTQANYDNTGFHPVTLAAAMTREVQLVGKVNEPVREVMTIQPVSITKHQSGEQIVDFGQNLPGVVRLRVRATTGTAITVRHAEMLQDDGSLYTANLRSAKATDRFVCKGTTHGQDEIFEPRFTFHGFRYAGLSGLPYDLKKEDIEAVVLMSDTKQTGSFECSNKDINQLYSNILWGQRGNFLEVPTDCPQRDERLGWTGDAQVFIPTACFNMDVEAFFCKWFEDVRDAQHTDGAIPHVAPDVLKDFGKHKKVAGAAAWADAAVICPWTIYLHYGDLSVLERNFDVMRRWVDWCEQSFDNLVGLDTWFGDWLATDTNWPYYAPTPRTMIGTAYLIRCADIVAKAAAALGREEEERVYTDLASKAREVFANQFVTPAGRLVGHTQTGYALAIMFNLCPHVTLQTIGTHYVSTLKARDWKLSSGFVGTPLLAPALTQIGRSDLAYRLLLNDEYPSWLFSIRNGATTIWERWDSWTPEKGFGDIRMNSFNHYAYGSIGQWLYQTVLGITPSEQGPGFKRFELRPEPSGGFTHASGKLHTPQGRIESAWHIEGEHENAQLTYRFRIPAMSSAKVQLPVDDLSSVKPMGTNSQKLQDAIEKAQHSSTRNNRVLECDSGSYHVHMPVFRNCLAFSVSDEVSSLSGVSQS